MVVLNVKDLFFTHLYGFEFFQLSLSGLLSCP
jgi:hypothetical protein